MEKEEMRNERIIVIGGSAGSLNIIFRLVQELGNGCYTPVVIVVHRLKTSGEGLKQLISQKTPLKVVEPYDKEKIAPGTIYIAPADYHLLIEKNKIFSLDYSERINFSRPSINPTFETAAETYGSDTIAILLSGANSDGVDGLRAIQKAGGVVVIQDPETAQTPYMPEQGLEAVPGAKVLSPSGIIDFVKINSCKE
jgi:two-component system, chemotaxis family, protein-glutamate methylesterase/glutaminase